MIKKPRHTKGHHIQKKDTNNPKWSHKKQHIAKIKKKTQ